MTAHQLAHYERANAARGGLDHMTGLAGPYACGQRGGTDSLLPSHAPALPYLELEALIAEVSGQVMSDVAWEPGAVEALRVAAEEHVVSTLRLARLFSSASGREATEPVDMHRAKRARTIAWGGGCEEV